MGGLNEASLRDDGRGVNTVTMFIRVGGGHAVAMSENGGETFAEARLLPALVGPTCQGSIGRVKGSPPGEVLLSAPFSHDMSLNGRENMAVWKVNVTDSGPLNPQLVARVFPCKAAYSSFGAGGNLNFFEGGETYRSASIMLAQLDYPKSEREWIV